MDSAVVGKNEWTADIEHGKMAVDDRVVPTLAVGKDLIVVTVDGVRMAVGIVMFGYIGPQRASRRTIPAAHPSHIGEGVPPVLCVHQSVDAVGTQRFQQLAVTLNPLAVDTCMSEEHLLRSHHGVVGHPEQTLIVGEDTLNGIKIAARQSAAAGKSREYWVGVMSIVIAKEEYRLTAEGTIADGSEEPVPVGYGLALADTLTDVGVEVVAHEHYRVEMAAVTDNIVEGFLPERAAVDVGKN